MNELYHKLSKELSKYFQNKYNISLNLFDFQLTRKEFDGDITLVVYPILKYIKLNPQVISKDIGEYLINSSSIISSYNIISGFLNFTISDNYYIKILNEIIHNDDYGLKKIDNNSKTIIVEFSSPNTNKPLHLGHIRNNLLGDSVAKILEANGNKVVKTQIINDRGIHICKSMVSWELYGNGDTPEKVNIKGDKFVGDFYVLFEKKYRLEIDRLIKKGHSEEFAKNKSPILLKAKEMLSKEERLSWLYQNLPSLDGTGLIYTRTIRDAEKVSEWLKFNGIKVEAYHSKVKDPLRNKTERREYLEDLLFNNQIKALVTTNALGMGYDKPDISFVIHYQLPGSLVSYYQQIGRAGRKIKNAYCFHLFMGMKNNNS